MAEKRITTLINIELAKASGGIDAARMFLAEANPDVTKAREALLKSEEAHIAITRLLLLLLGHINAI